MSCVPGYARLVPSSDLIMRNSSDTCWWLSGLILGLGIAGLNMLLDCEAVNKILLGPGKSNQRDLQSFLHNAFSHEEVVILMEPLPAEVMGLEAPTGMR